MKPIMFNIFDWSLFLVTLCKLFPAAILLLGAVQMALNGVPGWGWVLFCGIVLFLFRGKGGKS